MDMTTPPRLTPLSIDNSLLSRPTQVPYYPGHREPTPGMVVLPSEVEQRRWDGHGGRWDYSRVPQTFSPLRPWLGLMKREGKHSETEHEFASPYTVWNTPASEINREYIDLLTTRNTDLEQAVALRLPSARHLRRLLHSQCPIFPRLENLNDLKRIQTFDKAVDKLGECQRSIQEKQAWVALLTLIGSNPLTIPVGVWINGIKDEMVHWFLTQAALPCFLVSTPPRGVPLENARTGFMEGTKLEALSSTTYIYDKIAQTQNLTFTPTETNPLYANSVTRCNLDYVATNLHWKLELPWAYPYFPWMDRLAPSTLRSALSMFRA
ncbi:hypothetical protein K438DRAFT_1980393 [Mycena galopus ATCC 62051]|nr:hypothetical protein K438DRAFT_1980393 [Mycena galopus ATCC 62051]